MGARLYEIVGIAKDARYLTFWLDKPIAPFFFLPAQQHDFSPKAASTEVSPSSHFLRDIVIVTRAWSHFGRVQEAMASCFPGTALPPAPTVCPTAALWNQSIRSDDYCRGDFGPRLLRTDRGPDSGVPGEFDFAITGVAGGLIE